MCSAQKTNFNNPKMKTMFENMMNVTEKSENHVILE